MLEIVVLTEGEERHVRVSAGELAGLVRRIGAAGDRFLVVQGIPDLPDVVAQVWHEADEDHYVLQHREPATGHYEVRVDGPDAVTAALTGWARKEADWDAGLEWEALEEFDGSAEGPPPIDVDEEDRRLLEAHVRETLVGGYATIDELVELAEDYLVTEDHSPVSREQATALAHRMWRERVAEQETWEGETDPDRLTRAFTALEEAGVVARENFTCCRNCGQSEIESEAGPGARGYVFFHTQSTDSAAADHGLTLLYGVFDGASENSVAAIGHEVVASLEAVGLQTKWDHDPRTAIVVTPLDWRRRLVG